MSDIQTGEPCESVTACSGVGHTIFRSPMTVIVIMSLISCFVAVCVVIAVTNMFCRHGRVILIAPQSLFPSSAAQPVTGTAMACQLAVCSPSQARRAVVGLSLGAVAVANVGPCPVVLVVNP